jgi:hypothetical protein
MKTVHWTPEMLKRFKKAYDTAVEDGVTMFIFDGNSFLPDYAKYLIEYLTSSLASSKL